MKPILYLLFAALIISGCKKNHQDPQKHSVDVYISGTSVGDVDHWETIAGYWKNGVLTTVDDPAHKSEGYGITVKDNDVYVVGATFDPVKRIMVAAYWKNGAVNLLPGDGNHSSEATSIIINNSDIYIAGSSYLQGEEWERKDVSAVYWKNGERHVMGAFYNVGIEVKGNDIYSAGAMPYAYAKYRAIFWKNGIVTDLAPGQDAYVKDIYIQGNDVYVLGQVKTTAWYAGTYWKNGIPVQLLPDTASFFPRSIVAVNSDVYVGFDVSSGDHSIPYYWKNGNMIKVAESGYIAGLAVNGEDVYVCGILTNNIFPLAFYSVNGVAKPLDGAFLDLETQSKKYATTSGIVIVKH